jgi:hypothetical protein
LLNEVNQKSKKKHQNIWLLDLLQCCKSMSYVFKVL